MFLMVRKIRTLFCLLFEARDFRSKKALILSRALAPLVARKILPFLRPTCSFFPQTIVILSDGSVTTCCFDPFGFNRMGSVYEQDISVIWDKKVNEVVASGDLLGLKQCKGCIGSRHLRLFPKKADYLKWQGFSRQHPITIQLEVMGACNYGCCDAVQVYKYRINQQTKPDLDRIFDNIKSFLPKISALSLFNFGEPLMHEGFCDFVKKLRRGFANLHLSLATNGVFMDEKVCRCLIEQKVNEVSVSVHAGPGTENMLKYSKYGADYDCVMSNVKLLTRLRKEYASSLPLVEIKTILFDWNDSDESIEKMRRDARRAGVDSINWTVDCLVSSVPRASRRFGAGSAALKRLQDGDRRI